MIFLHEHQRSRLLKPRSTDKTCIHADPLPISLFPLLETPETKLQIPSEPSPGVNGLEPTLAETFRHSGWAHNRTLVYRALKRTGQSVSRISAFADCGAFAFVYQNLKPPFDYRLGGSSCRDRFCVPCAKDRARVLTTNVLTALQGTPARFLTLTLRVNHGPLATQIDRLYSCFGALRARAFWKKRVYGGCAFTEVKWSPKSAGWNVHVHCLLHGLYLPKPDVWRAWHKITGDSMIVDIKLVHDHDCIGRYVTKYVSKPLGNSYINRDSQFDELIRAMVGRRLCFTFGTWRGIKLTQCPEPGDWINIGSFHSLLHQAFDGDEDSLRAIRFICQDRTQELLDHVERARPPPTDHLVRQTQVYFEWNLPDPRF